MNLSLRWELVLWFPMWRGLWCRCLLVSLPISLRTCSLLIWFLLQPVIQSKWCPCYLLVSYFLLWTTHTTHAHMFIDQPMAKFLIVFLFIRSLLPRIWNKFDQGSRASGGKDGAGSFQPFTFKATGGICSSTHYRIPCNYFGIQNLISSIFFKLTWVVNLMFSYITDWFWMWIWKLVRSIVKLSDFFGENCWCWYFTEGSYPCCKGHRHFHISIFFFFTLIFFFFQVEYLGFLLILRFTRKKWASLLKRYDTREPCLHKIIYPKLIK